MLKLFFKIIPFAVAGAAFFALAQGTFTGRWVVEVVNPDGQHRDITFFLKQNGAALSGAVLMNYRMQDIAEGKVTGDEASWAVVTRAGTQERRAEYRAKLTDGQLHVSMPRVGNRPAHDVVAKRVSNDGTPVHPFASLPPPELPALHPLPDNGLARTPPMGWNSWNQFHGAVSDEVVRGVADAMVSSGMRDAGYVYVNIDDTWQGNRDAGGVLQPNKKFPDMKALADYVHGKGLKLGIYSSPGPRTCAGYEGSYAHELQDAKTWASWGIDYLKYDWCSASQVMKPADEQAAYQKMGEALRAAGRPIVYSLCQYGQEHVETWGPAVGGNLWRTTGDIQDNWLSMSRIGFDKQIGLERYSGPGHWNDPDMLEIGNGGMNDTEYRTHMSLWSLLAAPLLAGNDLRSMNPAIRDILENREVIAIDQDKAGHQAVRVAKDGDKEVWERQLAGGDWAVGLFNRGESPATVVASWSDLKLLGKHKVRDLWAHEDRGAMQNQFSSEVPAHGVVLVRISK